MSASMAIAATVPNDPARAGMLGRAYAGGYKGCL
jgi:hypothetical protein